MKPYRRKRVNLRIKPHLQARMLARLGLLLLVCVATGVAVFYLSGSHELGRSLRMAHFRIRHVEQLLLPTLGLATLLALILGFGASLLFPIRVVGPLPRLEAALRRIGGGDLTGRLTLRKGDVLEGTAGVFNEMSTGLRSRVNSLKAQAESLRYEADRLERLSEERPELGELIGPIGLMSRQLSRELESFDTSE